MNIHEYTCIRILFVFTNNFFFEFCNLDQLLYIKNICLVSIHIEITICICFISCSISYSMKISTLCSIISLVLWHLSSYSFLKLYIFVYVYMSCSSYAVQGQQRGDAPCPRSGGEAMSRYSTSKVTGSGCTLLEQLWRDTPRPRQEKPKEDGKCRQGIRGQTDWNNNHQKLANLIIWTTALSNSMQKAMRCGAKQDRWVIVERSDRAWSTGEGNGKPLQYSCLEYPMNSMKRQ